MGIYNMLFGGKGMPGYDIQNITFEIELYLIHRCNNSCKCTHITLQ